MTAVDPNTLKKTPLFDRHVASHGKLVDFAGWSLPIYYQSILSEHEWTRKSCSFFDVSHLGEIRVQGPNAFHFLQKRLTQDLRKAQDHRIIYSLICAEDGGTLDDILVYRENEHDYYLIVNASRIEIDLAELKKYAEPSVMIENNSDRTACLAVQGPKAEMILRELFGFELETMEYYSFAEFRWGGEPVWISRSGYTGEDGFEIFSSNALSVALWDRLEGPGRVLGALPAGLGARNTLRLEAGNPLYGHEMDEHTTPLEAGLGFAVSFEKGDFVGRSSLEIQKIKGLTRRLIAFKVIGKPIARDGYSIYFQDRKIGKVTSGSYGPTAGASVGLGFVEKGFEVVGTKLWIEIHGSQVPAEVVRRPFIELKHKRKV